MSTALAVLLAVVTSIFCGVLPAEAQATGQVIQVESSPISDRATAQSICPLLARSRQALWTGYWSNSTDGQGSLCEMIQLPPGMAATQQVPFDVANRTHHAAQISWLAPNGQDIPLGPLAAGTEVQVTGYVGSVIALESSGNVLARQVITGTPGEALVASAGAESPMAGENGFRPAQPRKPASGGARMMAATTAPKPASTPEPAATGGLTATILSVKCLATTYGPTGDHVYLLLTPGARIPGEKGHAIDTGEVWAPNHTIKTNGKVQVELMQYSIITASFEIGAFTISPGDTPGRFSKTLTGDGGKYVVTYEIK